MYKVCWSETYVEFSYGQWSENVQGSLVQRVVDPKGHRSEKTSLVRKCTRVTGPKHIMYNLAIVSGPKMNKGRWSETNSDGANISLTNRFFNVSRKCVTNILF